MFSVVSSGDPVRSDAGHPFGRSKECLSGGEVTVLSMTSTSAWSRSISQHACIATPPLLAMTMLHRSSQPENALASASGRGRVDNHARRAGNVAHAKEGAAAVHKLSTIAPTSAAVPYTFVKAAASKPVAAISMTT
jgi:hypothetical protein